MFNPSTIGGGAGGGEGHSAFPTRGEVADFLRSKGINPKQGHIASLLDNAVDAKGRISVHSVLQGPESLLKRAFEGSLAIQDWSKFKDDINSIYEAVKPMKGGACADYIPILAEADPNKFAVAITTVDGQQLVLGDADDDYSIQSCVKPLLYAVAAGDLGLKKLHRHVGAEPSGLAFNEISLNSDNLPHNSMINPGAIATAGLVGLDLDTDERFRYFLSNVSDMAGGEHVGFSQQTYLCEQETAWRNNALMYYLHEAGVFPKERKPEEILDFYLQACSVEVNTRAAANIAATMATGGICPTTGKQCISPQITKAVLTIMFSAGMYDYSGEWCVHVGLPAKSGVAGLVYCVIPHVMGVAIWSPPLDSHGNSVKGVEFCKRLLARYRFGIFNSLVSDELSLATAAPTRGESALASRDGKSEASSSRRPRGHSEDRSALQQSAHIYALWHTTLMRMRTLARSTVLIRNSVTVTPADEELAAELTEEAGPLASGAKRGYSSMRGVDLPSLLAFIRIKGLVPNRRTFPVLFTQLLRMVSTASRSDGVPIISLADMILPGESENLVLAALTRRLAMPVFNSFAADLEDIYRLVEDKREGELSTYSKMVLHGVDENAFGVAICTCDGQMISLGDAATKPVPLLQAVKPLLYALALKDVGAETVHHYVGTEPTAAAPNSFSLLKPSSHGPADEEAKEDPNAPLEQRPYNPFMDTGALSVCSLLGRAHLAEEQRLFHDKGSRFTHLISHFTQWAGGRKIGFNNPVFLALKKKALKTLALSHYIKGMGCYPPRTSPDDNSNLLLQAEAIQPRPTDLAVIAATIANRGVCPTSRVRCMRRDDVRWLLSLMYNAGLNQFTGKWNFSVGIPAATGSSGILMAVVPNVMGIVIYSPRVNAMGVPVRAIHFCEMLTKRYRINMFDQLVYRDAEVRNLPEPDKKKSSTGTLMFFELCMACSSGNIRAIEQLLEDGVDLNFADYDKRTALHIAASDGQLAVVKLLVKEGAEILVQDRWGQTPYDDAMRTGNETIMAVLERALRERGVRFNSSFRSKRTMGASPSPTPNGFSGFASPAPSAAASKATPRDFFSRTSETSTPIVIPADYEESVELEVTD